MDQHSETNADGGATYGGDISASYGLTYQPLPVPASQGAMAYRATMMQQLLNQQPSHPTGTEGVAYGATILQPSLLNQQPSHATGTEGGISGETPSAYALTPYNGQPAALASMLPSSSAGTAFLPLPVSHGSAAGDHQAAIPPPLSSNPHAIALQQHLHEQLQAFWVGQVAEAEATRELKFHSMPLARIKKIMRADEDVKMIAAETPVLFAKACEMFILELTMRAWLHTDATKRRTVQRSNVAAAIAGYEMFDFLMDVVPEELTGAGLVPPPQTPAAMAAPGQVDPPMHVPFPMYGNEQMWPIMEYQQQQQNSDGGQGE
ncbi:hypothetical protein HU200_004996 [Digitaria exilis]|uniref:Transcription factor CBF/NF-Y/archaeal histone domain-containing protein n=1 Tax=Digitaria exilis TaxID=1010633 RepID=A0A835KUH6_9POAL|nr:hypothetical protein HU200_004996 [Digitaria exilis]